MSTADPLCLQHGPDLQVVEYVKQEVTQHAVSSALMPS